MPDPQTNLPEVTVAELSGAIKRTVEDAFGYVRVRGEISGYRGPHSSGHVYFALKDATAKIEAVIWKGVFGRMRIRPEEGLEVIATGKVSTFPGKSSYQIVIESLEPAGVGALLAQLEERKRRLAAEGLFGDERKQPLPYLPAVIGVVTSPTGAVIRDIVHRIADRFPRHLLVWPVRVQGETSSAEVASAIRGFNAIPAGMAIPRPDVIVVARGGGSLEDLWGFNDEAVVRAAAESAIPLVSAVGHETDWTLIDYAADYRAPTPTGAAEKIVPVRVELLAATQDFGGRLAGALYRLIERRKSDLRSAARALPVADQLLSLPRQRLDRAAERLPITLRGGLDARRVRLSGLATRLAQKSPQASLARQQERLNGLFARLGNAVQMRLRREREDIQRNRIRLEERHERLAPAFLKAIDLRRQRLAATSSLLTSLSYEGVLARGYALVLDRDGAPVRDSGKVRAGQALNVRVERGAFDVIVGAPAKERGSSASPLARAKPQSDLFGDG